MWLFQSVLEESSHLRINLQLDLMPALNQILLTVLWSHTNTSFFHSARLVLLSAVWRYCFLLWPLVFSDSKCRCTALRHHRWHNIITTHVGVYICNCFTYQMVESRNHSPPWTKVQKLLDRRCHFQLRPSSFQTCFGNRRLRFFLLATPSLCDWNLSEFTFLRRLRVIHRFLTRTSRIRLIVVVFQIQSIRILFCQMLFT